jgi:tripartite-type tricarboxylate transporter receptor subunit TctC
LLAASGALLAGRSAGRAARAAPDAAWPDQPIKIVVPYPPGALTDVLGRLVGEHLHAAFGQPAIIDNRAGMGTQLGASYVAKQPADGCTLLLATVSTLCISPALYARPLVTHADFAPVAKLGDVMLYLVGRPDLPAKDPRELMALAATRPGGLSYGSPGVGSVHHLLAELLLSRDHLKALHVPYQGSVKAMVDLSESRFDFMFLDATAAPPYVGAGKIKALAVTGAARYAALPDVPALTEFFPGFDLEPWMSIVAPRGTPAAVLDRLNREINLALADRKFDTRLRDNGVQPTPLTVAAFGDFIANDARRWAELVRISGAKAE